jgi:hypothetical protein
MSHAVIYDTLTPILVSVRRQFRAFFPRMAVECVPWHLHRVPGTDQFSIFRDDAVFDVPLPRVVANVHAMTEEQLLARVTNLLRS